MMRKYEYKTVTLKQKGLGFVSRSIPDLERTLNREGREGWRLSEIVQPISIGEGTRVIVIFERKLEAN